MNGRIEKEDRARRTMEEKLGELPEVFTAFYDWMDSRDKSYTTMKNYINHIIEFKKFCDKRRKNEFYENVTDDTIEKYMSSIKRKTVDGESIEVGDDIRAAKWSSLNTFFKFLSQKKRITNNPMLLTERPRVKTEHTITYMTQKEIESVFKRILKEARPMIKNRDFCISSACAAVNHCSLTAYKTNGHKRPPTFINREFAGTLFKTHRFRENLAFSICSLFWRV